MILTISSGLLNTLSHSTESAVPPPVALNTPLSGLIERPVPTLTPPNVLALAIGNSDYCISILPSPSNAWPLVVLMLVPPTRVYCLSVFNVWTSVLIADVSVDYWFI